MASGSFGTNCDLQHMHGMEAIVKEAYARFMILFHKDEAQSYCYTPTNRAILHLLDLFRKCGQVPVTTQFVVERRFGEIGRSVRHRSNLTARILHTKFKLLPLKLADDWESPISCDPEMRYAEEFSRHSRSIDTAGSNVKLQTGFQCLGAPIGEV